MYIEWTKEKLEEFLKDKERTISPNEYLLLINFINKTRPATLIDIGTYLGASGYILGTCCDSIQAIYSIENINSPDYTPKPEADIVEHGKYLPEDAIFLKEGYESGILDSIIRDGNEFVFWDAGKNVIKVIKQFELSHKLKIKYIGIHDSNVKSVRRAIDRAVKLGWYKIHSEELSNENKGVSVLELC